MSKQKVTNTSQITTGEVKEKGDAWRCRETLTAIYASQAKRIFVEVACMKFHKTDTQLVSEEDVNVVLSKVTTDGGASVWVYTQPSDQANVTDDMVEVHKPWNKVLPIGRKWFKKEVPITDAFVLLRAYSNYIRFKEDGDKALLRSAKKVVNEMTQEELIAFVLEAQKKAQAQTADQSQTTDQAQTADQSQTDINGKQD